MTQTYRTDDLARWGSGQGFNLSPEQVDINFWDLIQRMIAQEERPDPSAGIAYFEISGVMMYVHMTDDTVLGPYELPVATFRDRGEWAPDTAYSVMDTFSINGGLYVVTTAHTSGATFDPGANDGAGHDYYQLMIQTPGGVLPAGGAVGQLLQKATTTDYEVMWGYTDAANVSYTNTSSGLASANVQDAIDEIAIGGSGGGSTIGKHTIWIPSTAMVPQTTNGAAVNSVEMTTNKNMVSTLDFDATTAEFAQFSIVMPKSWDATTNFICTFYWSHAATTTNFGVAFGIEATTIADNESLDVSFGGATYVVDTGGTTNRLYISTGANLLVSGGLADGNLVSFRVTRNPANGSDNLAVDARLHGVKILYTTFAETDD